MQIGIAADRAHRGRFGGDGNEEGQGDVQVWQVDSKSDWQGQSNVRGNKIHGEIEDQSCGQDNIQERLREETAKLQTVKEIS